MLSQTKCSKSLNEECYIVPSPQILMTRANYNDLCPQPIAAVYLIICPLKLLSQPSNVMPLYVPGQSAASIKSRDLDKTHYIRHHAPMLYRFTSLANQPYQSSHVTRQVVMGRRPISRTCGTPSTVATTRKWSLTWINVPWSSGEFR